MLLMQEQKFNPDMVWQTLVCYYQMIVEKEQCQVANPSVC
jgi:hypothetical protein